MQADIIKDLAGRPVDCTTDIWRLNTPGRPIVLDWRKLDSLPAPVSEAARMYARYRIPQWAPETVGGLYYMYRSLAKCAFFETEFAGVLTMRAFEELREVREESRTLNTYRGWYRWAAILGLPGFDPDVSKLLEALTISDDRPARKKDPKLGPLTDGERADLLNKTLSASEQELPLIERVAIFLSMGLGPNAGPLSLLQVQDYSEPSSGGTTYHLLKVPRHKKRFPKERADFRLRQIDSTWAPYLKRLIDQNHARADELYKNATGRPKPDNIAVPIFMRARIRTDLRPSMTQYALHMTPIEFTNLLKAASERLDAKSRDGEELHINTRRMRSTFATNLIADGKPKHVVADALDHSSTTSLVHYEFEDYRLVASLDASVGDTIQMVADTFLGTITEKSSEAARNRRPASRIPFFDRERDQPEDLGNCGSGDQGSCRLAAPLACYGCREFEPWIEAPHEHLLAQLKAERERRRMAKLHPRIVALQDRTIQALTEVVETIKAIREQR